MRIPLPERFSAKHTLLFATSLLVVQLAEGTDPLFAILTFAYCIIVALSYNAAGGIFYPSGAWILFTAVETTLIGLTFKALLGQRGDSLLQQPIKTMTVYCSALAGMGIAAWLSSRLRPRRGWLARISGGGRLYQSAVGCLMLGLFLSFTVGSGQSGSLGSAINQLNHFTQLSMLLATTYQIKHTNGKSSTNWIVWVAGAFSLFFGLISFSKEAMFTPFVSWLIPAIILRFNFSKYQVVLGAGIVFFIFYYLVPYSQVGRSYRDPDGIIANQFLPMAGLLENLPAVRREYLSSEEVTDIGDVPHLYQNAEGLFDRLQMLAFDDALMSVTDQGNVYGLSPMYSAFANSVPRAIWKDKPVFAFGNEYGHEIGVLAEDDVTTGISFSPTADAYHEAEWLGVVVILPVLIFILFYLADSLSGDVRAAPWGLLFIALFVHGAPEGELPGIIWLSTFGVETVILAALFSGYLIPFLSRFVTLRPREQRSAVASFVMPPAPRRRREAAGEGGPGPVNS